MREKNRKRNNESRAVLKHVYGYFLPSAWRQHKGYFFVMTAKLITAALQPFVGIIFTPKIIAELLGNRDAGVLIGYALCIVMLEYMLGLLNSVFPNMIERYSTKFENYYKSVLSKKIMELDFQLTEDKKALDQMELRGIKWYRGTAVFLSVLGGYARGCYPDRSAEGTAFDSGAGRFMRCFL